MECNPIPANRGHPSAMEVNNLIAERVYFRALGGWADRDYSAAETCGCPWAVRARPHGDHNGRAGRRPGRSHWCVVEVTGYTQVTLDDGSLGPVTVVVKGKRAAAIRSALAGLSATSSLPDCMEGVPAFTISFLTHQGGRPTYVATETDCPSPGIVSISVDGKATQHLQADCALRAAVIARLPRGRAEGTRRDEHRCSV